MLHVQGVPSLVCIEIAALSRQTDLQECLDQDTDLQECLDQDTDLQEC
jgi:hypothetical protein